jgi:hypothetical protein
MTPRIPEEFSIRLIDWTLFVVLGDTMPPRDPNEDDEDDEEEEDRDDEPPVVREPDEDQSMISPRRKPLRRLSPLCLPKGLLHQRGTRTQPERVFMNAPT